MNAVKKGRRRRSSSLMYTEPAESMEHISDQAVLPNLNAEWVHAKGMDMPRKRDEDVRLLTRFP